MKISLFISQQAAPAIGDVRALAFPGAVWLKPGCTERPDWPRYADAIITAVSRGAEVRWMR